MRTLVQFSFILTSLSITFKISAGSLQHNLHQQAKWNRTLKELPKSGSVAASTKKGWSGYYWPSKTEGLNLSVDYNQSPAAKWDALGWDKSLETLQDKQRRIAEKNKEDWNGICDGFSAASILFSEPRPVTVLAKSGENIFFSSTDIKALASYYMWTKHKSINWFAGSTCMKKVPKNLYVGEFFDHSCDDSNAGDFHLALSNEIGLRGQGIAMDLNREAPVWNSPVTGFRSKILGDYDYYYPNRDHQSTTTVLVETTIMYADYIGPEITTPVLGSTNQKIGEKSYRYVLELDSRGTIVGGEWVTWERPDFFWSPKMPEFNDDRGELRTLLIKSGALP